MQTIISYNEDEIVEQKLLEDSTLDKKKIWIDLEDPDKETLNTYIKKFNLDLKAVEQYTLKSKKPQIRVLDNH